MVMPEADCAPVMSGKKPVWYTAPPLLPALLLLKVVPLLSSWLSVSA